MQLVNTGQQLTMTSREIADLTGKDHRHVMRDIRELEDQLGSLFVGSVQYWTHPQNGQEYPEYKLDKDTSLTLLTGYDAVARLKVVKRWQELESQAAKPAELSRMEILQIAMEAEQGRLLAIEQRDEAIRTKSQISDKKTATAMATASAKSREVARLKHELGRNQVHATVKAVENVTRRKFEWRPLKAYCKDHTLDARKVVDEQYGSVNAWPAIAWRDVYGIDLDGLFENGENK